MPLFVTFVNVQGSHEYSCIEKPYKVLKRVWIYLIGSPGLRHIINYKVLKLLYMSEIRLKSLRHIINYKVLKLLHCGFQAGSSLRHIINYKVLKHLSIIKPKS